MREPGHSTSVYLSTEDRRLLEELEERTGMARSKLIRSAIRHMYVAGDGGRDEQSRIRLLEIAEEIRHLA